MNDQDLRTFARVGALATCLRAVAEFPDILAELNATASGKKREVLDGGPFLPSVSGARVRRAKRKGWSAAKRKAHSRMMKKRWAAKRAK